MCGDGGVGGDLVEWASCIPLSGFLVGWWRFGGVLEWYFNGILNKFHWVPFGSSTGVSLASWSSRWWGGIFVPLELLRFLVVFACGEVFTFFQRSLKHSY